MKNGEELQQTKNERDGYKDALESAKEQLNGGCSNLFFGSSSSKKDDKKPKPHKRGEMCIVS